MPMTTEHQDPPICPHCQHIHEDDGLPYPVGAVQTCDACGLEFVIERDGTTTIKP